MAVEYNDVGTGSTFCDCAVLVAFRNTNVPITIRNMTANHASLVHVSESVVCILFPSVHFYTYRDLNCYAYFISLLLSGNGQRVLS
jgi:hypothetical protein